MLSEILPPDSPADLWPVPYERRLVERSLPLARNQTASLKAEGVHTLGDLDTWFVRGGKLIALAGIGPKSEKDILDAYQSLLETKDLANTLRAEAKAGR